MLHNLVAQVMIRAASRWLGSNCFYFQLKNCPILRHSIQGAAE